MFVIAFFPQENASVFPIHGDLNKPYCVAGLASHIPFLPNMLEVDAHIQTRPHTYGSCFIYIIFIVCFLSLVNLFGHTPYGVH